MRRHRFRESSDALGLGALHIFLKNVGDAHPCKGPMLGIIKDGVVHLFTASKTTAGVSNRISRTTTSIHSCTRVPVSYRKASRVASRRPLAVVRSGCGYGTNGCAVFFHGMVRRCCTVSKNSGASYETHRKNARKVNPYKDSWTNG